MKKVLAIALAFVALMMTMACNSKKAETQEAQQPKYLVLCYSQTGATKQVAEQLKGMLPEADIEFIQVEQPYDGTYQETIERCIKERQDSVIPAIVPIQSDLTAYDKIFLAYPVWFGTYAMPIKGLVNQYDFAGQTIVPVVTFGSGGLEASSADLKEALPQATILEGYGVRNARVEKAAEELDYFLKANGYIEGEVVELPEYSQQQPLTEEQSAIYHAATDDYMFPLGNPVSVGERQSANSHDYKYVVETQTPDGQTVNGIIYVTVENGSNKPEFTRVVR